MAGLLPVQAGVCCDQAPKNRQWAKTCCTQIDPINCQIDSDVLLSLHNLRLEIVEKFYKGYQPVIRHLRSWLETNSSQSVGYHQLKYVTLISDTVASTMFNNFWHLFKDFSDNSIGVCINLKYLRRTSSIIGVFTTAQENKWDVAAIAIALQDTGE